MSKDVRQQIEEALIVFTEKDLRTASIDLLNTLGYRSDKTLDLGNSYELRKVFFEKIPIKKPDKSTAKFFYQYANSSEHPIRERLKRIPFESPELLGVIKEEGKA